MHGTLPEKEHADPVEQLVTSATQQQLNLAKSVVFLRKAIVLRPGEARCPRLLGMAYQRRDWAAPRSAVGEAGRVAAATLSPPASTAGPSPPPTPPEPAAVPHLAGSPASPADAEPASPAAALPALTADQVPAFLQMMSECLADIAATERLIEEQGRGAEETLATIKSARRELTVQLYKSRPDRPSGLQAPPAPTAAPPAGTPAAVPSEYRCIPAFTQTLGPGAVQKGPEVTQLQKLLQLEGMAVPISGQFDNRTARAISKLQEKYKLKGKHGIVGSETRQLLNQLLGKSQ